MTQLTQSTPSPYEGDDFASREFRRGVWHRTLTMVAMVTAAADGRENVMACEWAMMTSGSPLQFAISIWSEHVTHELVTASGAFGLSFCSDQQARLSHVSGSYSAHEVNKWELADFPTYPAQKIAAPMIAECPLNVECRVVASVPTGGYTLFVGEAVWAKFDPEKEPLIYHGGKYYYVGGQVPKD